MKDKPSEDTHLKRTPTKISAPTPVPPPSLEKAPSRTPPLVQSKMIPPPTPAQSREQNRLRWVSERSNKASALSRAFFGNYICMLALLVVTTVFACVLMKYSVDATRLDENTRETVNLVGLTPAILTLCGIVVMLARCIIAKRTLSRVWKQSFALP